MKGNTLYHKVVYHNVVKSVLKSLCASFEFKIYVLGFNVD